MSTRSGQIKEEGIVLRSIRHGETSRIVTIFGKSLGKFAVIAKGIRGVKNRTGGLEIPSIVEVIVYFKPGRSVQNLGQVNLINSFDKIRNSLTLTGFAAAAIELTSRTTTENEPNLDLYHAVVATLNRYEMTDSDPILYFWKFQLELMHATGFALDPFACPICGNEMVEVDRKNFMLLDLGAFCCRKCAENGINNRRELSGESVSLLRRLADNRVQGLERIKPSSVARKELSMMLEQYIRFHHPELGNLPALSMLQQLVE